MDAKSPVSATTVVNSLRLSSCEDMTRLACPLIRSEASLSSERSGFQRLALDGLVGIEGEMGYGGVRVLIQISG